MSIFNLKVSLYTKEKIYLLSERVFILTNYQKVHDFPILNGHVLVCQTLPLTHRNARRAYISAHIISGLGKRLPELPALHEITILNRPVKAQTKTKTK